MSCYDWEAGTITLSTKTFRTVLTSVQQAQATRSADLLRQATALHARTAKLTVKQIAELRQETEDKSDDGYRLTKNFYDTNERGMRTPRSRPRKPQKQDYPIANGSTLAFSAEECAATFDRKARTVRWSVSENNHACERAHATWLGKALFNALGRLSDADWTRGTGGAIVGNDEYARDSREDGGGANYTKFSYPPPKRVATPPSYGFAPRYGSGYGGRRW